MQWTFNTPDPVSLHVELHAGDLLVRTGDRRDTVVEVVGPDADGILVEQHGDDVVVTAKPGGRRGFFGSSHALSVQVTVPDGGLLSTKVGSAGVRVEGRLAEAAIQSGSGDVHVDLVTGPVTVRTGSGQVTLGRLTGPAQVTTGSGDVLVASAQQPVRVKSASGTLRVGEARDDVSLDSASGDLVVDLFHSGRLSARNASGDIRVGIPAGVPVWTDIVTVSGRVHSDLDGVGEPAEGQDYVELRAKTVSGDVVLLQL